MGRKAAPCPAVSAKDGCSIFFSPTKLKMQPGMEEELSVVPAALEAEVARTLQFQDEQDEQNLATDENVFDVGDKSSEQLTMPSLQAPASPQRTLAPRSPEPPAEHIQGSSHISKDV